MPASHSSRRTRGAGNLSIYLYKEEIPAGVLPVTTTYLNQKRPWEERHLNLTLSEKPPNSPCWAASC